MSKFMLIMRGTDRAKADFETMDFAEVLASMGRYNESMLKAGVMVGGEGLSFEPGVVVDFDQNPPQGPDDFPADNEWVKKEREWIENGYSGQPETDA